MKKIVYILIGILMYSCSGDDTNDCIQNAGKIIQQEIAIAPFSNILVNRDIKLVIKEAVDYSVIIETGEYLLNDVEAVVVGNELQLTNYNTCNFVRDFGLTTIYVTGPDIKNIRSSTQYSIESDGILNYDNLKLFSENVNGEGEVTSGIFSLDIKASSLKITSNNLSSFFISGEVDDLFVGFYSGNGRFEGQNLIAQKVDVYHRGSNDIIVKPQEELKGDLYGTGNLISITRPPIVEVEQYYTGRLIFD